MKFRSFIQIRVFNLYTLIVWPQRWEEAAPFGLNKCSDVLEEATVLEVLDTFLLVRWWRFVASTSCIALGWRVHLWFKVLRALL